MKTKAKGQSLSHIIKNNLYLLKIVWKEAPGYLIFRLLGDMTHQVVVFIEHVYMIGYIIDSIQFQRPFANVAIFILSVFTFLVLHSTMSHYILARIEPKAIERINRRLKMELYNKAITMDLECYDNPKFYDDFVWAMSNATARVEQVIGTTTMFLGSIVGILMVGGYVLSRDYVGLVFAAVAVVAFLLIGSKANKKQFTIDSEMIPLKRKRDYINRVLYLSDYAKEIRLCKVKSKLYEDFAEATEKLDKTAKKHTKILVVYEFILMFCVQYLLFDGIYILYLMYNTIVTKLFSYGTMVTLYNASRNLTGAIIQLSQVLPQFEQHSLYIDKIRSFLDYETKIKTDEYARNVPGGAQSISLVDVGFTYAGTTTPVLKNINMTIHKGQKVALVGYNGAGKTTLVKLIMRLYDVTSGEIMYNKFNIKEYKLEQYRNEYATVFQDHQLFSATLGENISMDSDNIDELMAVGTINLSGFDDKFKSLENGLETQLTKEFSDDGAILSGGEAQKVAISRALYQQSSVIILDEPSSALDPIAEYNLNDTMLHLESDKTVIFISHRLSTTKMADKIFMLENGEIIEEGNHDELMAINRKYAEMFNLQSEKYR